MRLEAYPSAAPVWGFENAWLAGVAVKAGVAALVLHEEGRAEGLDGTIGLWRG